MKRVVFGDEVSQRKHKQFQVSFVSIQNYSNQAYSCPRDWRLFGNHVGPIGDTAWNVSNTTVVWYRGV